VKRYNSHLFSILSFVGRNVQKQPTRKKINTTKRKVSRS